MAEQTPIEIDVNSLDEMSRSGKPHHIVDVREPWEVAQGSIEGSLNIPMGRIPANVRYLPREGDLVIVCHHGVRSFQVMEWLRGNGFANATSLRGGIDAWARSKDSSLGVY